MYFLLLDHKPEEEVREREEYTKYTKEVLEREKYTKWHKGLQEVTKQTSKKTNKTLV